MSIIHRLGDRLPELSPASIKEARAASGLSQTQAAMLTGLSSGTAWSEYERGVRNMDPARWVMFLLATGQHPEWELRHRRQSLPP